MPHSQGENQNIIKLIRNNTYETQKIKIYKTIILPVVLYGCEAWSLTLKEEFRLRVFENKIRRRIFEPMRDEN
jgi:hypothetical protein